MSGGSEEPDWDVDDDTSVGLDCLLYVAPAGTAISGLSDSHVVKCALDVSNELPSDFAETHVRGDKFKKKRPTLADFTGSVEARFKAGDEGLKRMLEATHPPMKPYTVWMCTDKKTKSGWAADMYITGGGQKQPLTEAVGHSFQLVLAATKREPVFVWNGSPLGDNTEGW